MFAPCRLAAYEPSEVITDSRYWTVLRSPDPVEAVSRFYALELSRRGWRTTSEAVSGRGATLVARLGPHGTTISINDVGANTSIMISAY
jgi:hypothetical protein